MTPPDRRPASTHAPASSSGAWQRLSGRIIWVGVAQIVLSTLPAAVAVAVFRVPLTPSAMWPFAIVVFLGVAEATSGFLRWRFTQYRISDTEVERRTGIFVRRYRAVPRDRIRSVDTHAKLKHRLIGLRVVEIGAGQQLAAGESAFTLDALPQREAETLRTLVSHDGPSATAPASRPLSADPPVATASTSTSTSPPNAPQRPPATPSTDQVRVLARLRPAWVLYNSFGVGGFAMAAGLLWGGYWLAQSLGLDLLPIAARSVGWGEFNPVVTAAIILVATGLLGALGMSIAFFITNWSFSLARITTPETSVLRTRRGLVNTREISRDAARIRGLSISEPLFWRWMGMTDTSLITTGLSLWAPAEPTALLPRGPKRVAVAVASEVLGSPCPVSAQLTRPPQAALLRRASWATTSAIAVVAILALPVASGLLPTWSLLASLAVWLLALTAAIVSYRALGHAVSGTYIVVRSGLINRHTSALSTNAVSTLAIRQSIIQRWLGVTTLSAMTSAGWSSYSAFDLRPTEAVSLTQRCLPKELGRFVSADAATERL